MMWIVVEGKLNEGIIRDYWDNGAEWNYAPVRSLAYVSEFT